MNILESLNQARNQKTCTVHIELLIAHLVSQVTARHQIHNLEKVLVILKRVMHVDNEVTLDVLEKPELVHDRLDFFAASRFRHLFHRKSLVERASPVRFNFVDAAKASSSNDLQSLELSLIQWLDEGAWGTPVLTADPCFFFLDSSLVDVLLDEAHLNWCPYFKFSLVAAHNF